MQAECPAEDFKCMLLAQTKDAKIVCVIRCQITRTWIHTSLKRLASARHNNGRIPFLHIECTLQIKQSLKTKKMDDVLPGAPLYCSRAMSDIIGCRRPTCGVFVCMLQTRVKLTAFPIATPRGRSSKFSRKGNICIYLIYLNLCIMYMYYQCRKHLEAIYIFIYILYYILYST